MGINFTNSWGQVTDNTAQLADIAQQRIYDNIFESFDRVDDWLVANGTAAEESTIVRNGKSLKVTTDVAATCSADKGILKYFGIAPTIQFYLYTDDQSAISSVGVLIGSSVDLSVCYSKSVNVPVNGWNLITIYPSDWYQNGGELWTNKMIVLRIRVVAASGKSAIAYLDDLTINAESTPRCIITFDDGRISQYSTAFSYMESKGVKGVIYAIHDRAGTDGYCTEAQFAEMYAAGWDIANHTYSHEGTAGGTYAKWVSELSQCQQWLDSLGFTKSSRHVAYPGGVYNSDTLQAMNDTGMLTGRTVKNRLQYTNLRSDIDEQYLLSPVYIMNTMTVSTVKAYIDSAIDAGVAAILCFHAIETVSTKDIEYPTADFQEIIDYVVSKRLPVVTMSGWWNELSQPYFKKI